MEILKKLIEKENKAQANLLKRLVVNPSYELSWVAEDLFKASFVSTQLSYFLSSIEKSKKTELEDLACIRESVKDQIDLWTYQHSSNPISTIESVWKLEAFKNIYKILGYYLEK